MPKKVKTRYVSQEEINKHLREPHGHTQGWGSAREGIVLVRKGSPEHVKLHEEYHVKAKHPNKPRSPKDFFNQELDAHLYSYNKVKAPQHIAGRQIAIFNEIDRVYKSPPSKTLKIMRSVINSRNDIPDTWKNDFSIVEKRYKEYQKGKKS